jgi:hypothetical protein
MSFITDFRTWYRHAFVPPLALQSFAALMAVKPNQHGPLAALLARLDAAADRAYPLVPDLHALRWILFVPGEKATANAADAPRALLFTLAFNGEIEDLLSELMQRVGADLRAVLQHCEGFYDESENVAAYITRRQVPCGFTFRDIGPLNPDTQSGSVADATLSELREAAPLLDQFASFYANHPPAEFAKNAEPLRKEFLEKFSSPARPRASHPLEERQPEEERWVRLASELMRRKQRRVARRMSDGVVRRSAHAKGHGLVRATFKICKSRYEVGLFKCVGQEIDAVLRPSNASDGVHGDRQPDARGLAISLNVPDSSGQWLGVHGQQDFLLIDHPVFFAPNIQGFVRMLAIEELRDWRRQLWHRFRLLCSRGGLKQVLIGKRTLSSRPKYPLEGTFHSAVPYQLGHDYIVKYSVQRSKPISTEPPPSVTSDDFLSAALESSLPKPICLDFFVHVLPVNGDERTLKRAVEDATLDWSHLKADREKVATIEIGPQSEDVTTRARLAEKRSFKPWNALEEHRPLGSINRARWTAYREGAQARAAANDAQSGALPAPRNLRPPKPDRAPDSEAAE